MRKKQEAIKAGALLAVLLLSAGSAAAQSRGALPEKVPEAARSAYLASDYRNAVNALHEAAADDPGNGDIQLLLTKSYIELLDFDAAIGSAEKAVSIEGNNSKYHEWLGRAYGNKAEKAGMFGGLGLAKKTHKEFEDAVRLDERNFAAQQANVEFDCSAPGIAGGGEDKATPFIERLLTLDAAEGHYAKGNCRRQKKDFTVANDEFAKALEAKPKRPDMIYDIGDYAMKHNEAVLSLSVADAGEKADSADPRGKFYRAVGLILNKQKTDEAQKMLREYLGAAPKRTGYPRASTVHEWLGRAFEAQSKNDEAVAEYQEALKLDPKNKSAQAALKHVD